MAEARPESSPARSLRQRGLVPRKRLGQNFLRDRSFLARILEAADLRPDDVVLEIGPGTGVLTRALADRAASVLAVELDDGLVDLLRAEFAGAAHVRIIHSNALDVDPRALMDGPYKLIGNIPYYITAPIIRHFLETHCKPALLVLMVQREVAERMTARPGRLSMLGVSVQYYARAEIVMRVPAAAFYPRPKVESAVVRLTPYETVPPASFAQDFFTVVRAGFSAPRKQLGNALSHGLSLSRPTADRVLEAAGIDPVRRAETLSVEEWREVAGVYARTEEWT